MGECKKDVTRLTPFVAPRYVLNIFTTWLLQLRITLYDSSSPEERTFTEMTVHVLRNEYNPVFSEETYTKTILANMQLGTIVTMVTATDNDVVRKWRYFLLS